MTTQEFCSLCLGVNIGIAISAFCWQRHLLAACLPGLALSVIAWVL